MNAFVQFKIGSIRGVRLCLDGFCVFVTLRLQSVCSHSCIASSVVHLRKTKKSEHRNARNARKRARVLVRAVASGSIAPLDKVAAARQRLDEHHGTRGGDMSSHKTSQQAWQCNRGGCDEKRWMRPNKERCIGCSAPKPKNALHFCQTEAGKAQKRKDDAARNGGGNCGGWGGGGGGGGGNNRDSNKRFEELERRMATIDTPRANACGARQSDKNGLRSCGQGNTQ